ncbi:transporter permease protein [Cystoisospora suis]|uniref:Transporter permease protein n=1 Tax=Cystoisospora suis TaxID=483139 RepID=A0A2C6KEM7_9APIC|nr:transporter permease protein [Cystoisospora suis]
MEDVPSTRGPPDQRQPPKESEGGPGTVGGISRDALSTVRTGEGARARLLFRNKESHVTRTKNNQCFSSETPAVGQVSHLTPSQASVLNRPVDQFVDFKLGACLALFLTAYCVQPLLVDALKFEGAASTSTCLYLIPHFLGMLCVIFTPNASRCSKAATACFQGPARRPLLQVRSLNLNLRAWRKAFFVAAIDLLHQLAEKAGLVLCGSGAYVLVSSSSIVWIAVLSAIMLQRHISVLQWLSLCLVCLGVSMKAFELTFELDNEECLGVFVTLIASVLQGLTFVVNESIMKSTAEPVTGPALVFMMGTICSSVLLAWTCVWTVPNFQILIADRVHERGGDPRRIALILLGLFCSGAVHSSTLWYIVKRLGAVTTGVLKGAKTASVFLLGHIFFCHLQPSQCLTPVKSMSAAVCIAGVVLYYLVTSWIPVESASTKASVGESGPNREK